MQDPSRVKLLDPTQGINAHYIGEDSKLYKALIALAEFGSARIMCVTDN
jgi:hypothetical protein